MTYNGEDRGAEKITSFTQLRSWQNARELAVYIYRLTEKFPSNEKFGLSSQIQRSVVSVPANIAEGFSRSGAKEKANFYSFALGSLTETLSHAYISFDLGFITAKELQFTEDKVTDLHKMINGLMNWTYAKLPRLLTQISWLKPPFHLSMYLRIPLQLRKELLTQLIMAQIDMPFCVSPVKIVLRRNP